MDGTALVWAYMGCLRVLHTYSYVSDAADEIRMPAKGGEWAWLYRYREDGAVRSGRISAAGRFVGNWRSR